MKEKELKSTTFIQKRLNERRNGDKESRNNNEKCLKKSASAFITRRMDGIYEKDEEAM